MKGRCVICDRLGSLTRDHVPPKGVSPPSPFVLRRLTDVMAADRVLDEAPRRGFRAPDFPSLCRSCNGARLGAEFDPALIAFASESAAWVRAALDLGMRFPAGMVTNLKVGRVVRSVIGHLLAAEERTDPTAVPARGALQDAMCACFLDENANWPTGLRVYCWPYSGADVVIARGIGLGRILGRTYGPIVGDVLKFFPLAFWVTQQSTAPTGYTLVDLAALVGTHLDVTTRVVMPLHPFLHHSGPNGRGPPRSSC